MRQIIYVGKSKSFLKYLEKILQPYGFLIRKFSLDSLRQRNYQIIKSSALVIIDATQEWNPWTLVLTYIKHLIEWKFRALVVFGPEFDEKKVQAMILEAKQAGVLGVVQREESDKMMRAIFKFLGIKENRR